MSSANCPPWADDELEPSSPGLHAAAKAMVERARGEWTSAIPSTSHVMGWHHGCFAAVVPVPYYAGNFRQVDPQMPCLDKLVGPRRDGHTSAAGVPAADVPRQMHQLMRMIGRRLDDLRADWEQLSSRDRSKRLAILIGHAIGEFICIHPFINGNGRTSRIMWGALLGCFGLRPHLKAVVRRPAAGYGAAMAASMKGDHSAAVALVLLALSAPLNAQAAVGPNYLTLDPIMGGRMNAAVAGADGVTCEVQALLLPDASWGYRVVGPAGDRVSERDESDFFAGIGRSVRLAPRS